MRLNNDASGIGRYWKDDVNSLKLPSPCVVQFQFLNSGSVKSFFPKELKITFEWVMATAKHEETS